jgi:type III secretion protein T
MSPAELSGVMLSMTPHVIDLAACAARLLPVTFLCPLLGGAGTPTTVKLATVLALSGFLHFSAGVGVDHSELTLPFFVAVVFKEFLFGTTLGLIAALPFDAARTGGRFIDLFRGSSAEASLPSAGTRESVLGDGLYQLLVALASASIAFPLVIGALARSFAWVPAGTASPSEGVALHAVSLAGNALATGLAIGAPIAGLAMAIDATVGLISRVSPQMSVQDTSTPLKILAGGAVARLAVGFIVNRLMGELLEVEGSIRLATRLVR